MYLERRIDMKIAISGPAAAGKGTIARKVAAEINIGYVDLGLIFRLGAFALQRRKVASLDELFKLIKNKSVIYTWFKKQAKITWQGRDITNLLLDQEVARQTSILSSNEKQQEGLTRIANFILTFFSDVICDGRNAGITILPDADFKFFITASLQERARRRHFDLQRLGKKTSYAEVLSQIEERDHRDQKRLSNPLVIPSGATVVETDKRSVEDSVRYILEVIGKIN